MPNIISNIVVYIKHNNMLKLILKYLALIWQQILCISTHVCYYVYIASVCGLGDLVSI